MYAKIVDGAIDTFPYSLAMLKKEHANVSFPKKPSNELLETFGMHVVVLQDDPDFDRSTHKVTIAETPVLVDGQWTQTKSLTALSEDDIERERKIVRTRRNDMLAETDWMAVSDRTMSQDWADYRQALRDVTSQDGFPFDVTWPTKPAGN